MVLRHLGKERRQGSNGPSFWMCPTRPPHSSSPLRSNRAALALCASAALSVEHDVQCTWRCASW